mmetsp:Transcript_27882/g.89916  ORF Transcript_27882/g.89916 Transcript_27882/m.89916 type:complete len:205 (-) Transcript_27882:442-1056(-)
MPANELLHRRILRRQRQRETVPFAVLVLQPLRRPETAQGALCHDANARGHRPSFNHVVGSEQHEAASFFLLSRYEGPDLSTSLRVQSSGWLIQEQNGWVPNQGNPKRQTAPHPARELRSFHAKGISIELHPLCDALDDSSLLLSCCPLEPCIEQEVLPHSEIRPHRVELWADAQHLMHIIHLRVNVEPSHRGSPSRGFDESRKH